MSRSLRDHSLIAALSLGLAWMAWTDAAQPDDLGPQVLAFDADSLGRIHWQEGNSSLMLCREGGPGAAIQLTFAAAGPGGNPEPGEPSGAPPSRRPRAPDAPDAPETWPASAAAAELFTSLPQLRALRRLPAPDNAQRSAWRLDSNAAILTLRGSAAGRAAEASLKVGAGTYGEHDWVVERGPGEIFLVARHHLSGLAQARTRLQAREAVELVADRVDSISLRLGEVHRGLRLQRADGGDDGAALAAWWVDDSLPNYRLVQVEPWLSHCLQLRVARLLAAPPAGPPALEAEFTDGSGKTARLQIWPLQADGAPARSSRFATPVLLHPGAAEAVLRGAQSVAWEGRLSGGPAAAAAPSAAP